MDYPVLVALLLNAACAISSASPRNYHSVDLKMPGVQPSVDEQYLCYTLKVHSPGYIVKFSPVAHENRIHHIILLGCSAPNRPPGNVWDCEHHAICDSGVSKILFSWARNGQPLALPPDVGLAVGGDSGIDYYVLQVHYNLKFVGEILDYSGLILNVTTLKPRYFATILLMLSGSQQRIPPHLPEYALNISCYYSGPTPLHMFAYRTHAHSLGRIITGYKVLNDHWTLIGKGNPQWPQTFYATNPEVVVEPGSYLAAQCIFDSTAKSNTTNIGAHGKDEMCNFYIYLYVDAAHANILKMMDLCFDSNDTQLFDSYPPEARVPLADNPLMEMEAHMTTGRFGIKEVAWPQTPTRFGEISGITKDNDGNMIVFHRGEHSWNRLSFDQYNRYLFVEEGPIVAQTVIAFDKNSRVIKRWGNGLFYLPHGIHVDNDNFLWLTDVAMHQVFKFDWKNGATHPMLTLGERFRPGRGLNNFCKPSAVATTTDGLVVVADGYCNNRVMLFHTSGKFIKSWPVQFTDHSGMDYSVINSLNLPHDLSIDEERKLVYVADRGNGRVVVVDFDGTVVGIISDPKFGGAIYGVAYCAALNAVFVINGRTPLVDPPAEMRVFAFDASNHRLMYSWRPQDWLFENTHSIAVSSDCSDVYIGEINPNRITKFQITAAGKPLGYWTKVLTNSVTKPSRVSTTVTDSFRYRYHSFPFSLMVALSVVLLCAAVMLIQLRRRGFGILKKCCPLKMQNYKFDLTDAKANPLLHSSAKWKKGFKPLSTEDVDEPEESLSDDSDGNDDTLFPRASAPSMKA